MARPVKLYNHFCGPEPASGSHLRGGKGHRSVDGF